MQIIVSEVHSDSNDSLSVSRYCFSGGNLKYWIVSLRSYDERQKRSFMMLYPLMQSDDPIRIDGDVWKG